MKDVLNRKDYEETRAVVDAFSRHLNHMDWRLVRKAIVEHPHPWDGLVATIVGVKPHLYLQSTN